MKVRLKRRSSFLPHHGLLTGYPLVPALPVRTSSKRRARTPRIHQEETVTAPRQLRSSQGKNDNSIAEEPQQENDHPEIKNVPVVDIRRPKHVVQATPIASPTKADSQSQKASTTENGIISMFLARGQIGLEHKLILSRRKRKPYRVQNPFQTPI